MLLVCGCELLMIVDYILAFVFCYFIDLAGLYHFNVTIILWHFIHTVLSLCGFQWVPWRRYRWLLKKKEQKFFQAKYKSTAITVAAAAVVKAWPPPPHQHFRRLQKWLVLCSTVEQNVTCFMWNGLFFFLPALLFYDHTGAKNVLVSCFLLM